MIVVIIFFGLPQTVKAMEWGATFQNLGSALTNAPSLIALGTIAVLVMSVFGSLDGIILKVIIDISKYNNFINEPSIISAWVIIRDLCNMFFILILLVVAFATILRRESYEWKKILPKLLIMAVLINFSRIICGLIIDASQIVMLTFVNTWANTGGEFVDMFKMYDFFSGTFNIKNITTSNWSVLQVVSGMIIGIMFLIISGIVLLVAMAVFTMRVIMLWIYIVLSPLAFMAAAFPAGQKYASQWWSEFIKYILNGPALAFFIWLALVTSKQITDDKIFFNNPANAEQCFGITQGMCLNNFLPFIISIAMLLGGLMITQQIGGVGSSIAGKGLAWAKRAPMMFGKGAMKGMVTAGAWGARKVKTGAFSNIFAERKITKVQGVDGKWTDRVSWTGKFGSGKIGAAIGKAAYGLELNPKNVIKGVKETLERTKQQDITQGSVASKEQFQKGGVGGLIKGLGVSRDMSEALISPGGFLWHKGFGKLKDIGFGSEKKREQILSDLDNVKKDRGYTRKEAVDKQKEFGDTLDKKDKVEKETAKNSKDKEDEIERLEIERHQADLLGDKEKVKELDKEIKINKNEKKAYDLGQQKVVDRLEKLAKKQEEEYNLMLGNIKADKEVEKSQQRIDALQKQKRKYMPIQTYYADREQQALVAESQKKLGGIDNEEQLVDMYNNAIDNHDKFAAAGIMLQAAKVGHLNEIIQSQIATKTADDADGNREATEGKYFEQSQGGFNQHINQVLIDQLGMSQQQALQIQSEASTLAKNVGHFNLAESVGSEDGMLVQRTKAQQQARTRGEFRKTDPERSMRDRNRLAWGDEYIDENGKRKFRLNQLGMDNFVEWADNIDEEIGRGRFNKNAAMNIASDKQHLLDYVRELNEKGIKSFKKEKTEKDGSVTVVEIFYEDLANKLIEYGENVNELQDSEGKADELAKVKASVLGINPPRKK